MYIFEEIKKCGFFHIFCCIVRTLLLVFLSNETRNRVKKMYFVPVVLDFDMTKNMIISHARIQKGDYGINNTAKRFVSRLFLKYHYFFYHMKKCQLAFSPLSNL